MDKVSSSLTCHKCGIPLSANNTYYRDRPKKILRTECKDCTATRLTDCRFKRVYGITLKEYEERAKHGCSICGLSETEHGKRLCIDHCHESGITRNVLCFRCNHLLGLAEDSIELLKKSISYLKEHQRRISAGRELRTGITTSIKHRTGSSKKHGKRKS